MYPFHQSSGTTCNWNCPKFHKKCIRKIKNNFWMSIDSKFWIKITKFMTNSLFIYIKIILILPNLKYDFVAVVFYLQNEKKNDKRKANTKRQMWQIECLFAWLTIKSFNTKQRPFIEKSSMQCIRQHFFTLYRRFECYTYLIGSKIWSVCEIRFIHTVRMSISCARSTVKIIDEKSFIKEKNSTDPIVGKQYPIISSATKAVLIIDAETGTINQNGNRMHIWLKQ